MFLLLKWNSEPIQFNVFILIKKINYKYILDFFLEDIIHMLGYMPSLPQLNKRKRRKEKITNNDVEDINEESAAVCEDKNLLLEVDESYGQNVKMALSCLNERDIPLEIIEVKFFKLYNLYF